MMSVGLVLVGAGSSRRMGDIDKIWEDLGGHPVVWHSVSRLAPMVDECVLVVRQDQLQMAVEYFSNDPLLVVSGGQQRSDSVARGLAALGQVDFVAVHDVARPFATPDLLRRGLAVVRSHDAAVPGVPVVDTLKLVSQDGTVTGTLPRSHVRAVQTPQIFAAQALRRAHTASAPDSAFTDDAGMLEKSGYSVHVFPGEPGNFKITTPRDLVVARLLWEGDDSQ